MPWQQVIQHVSDHQIIVKNRSGDTYPVEVPSTHLADMVYQYLLNPDKIENYGPIWPDTVKETTYQPPPWLE